MPSAVTSFKAVPFFLPGSHGDLFAVYYPPHCTPSHGALLYVHPFAEEANWARPVIAAVGRAIARLGYGVLTVDLFGCGDSAGEFRDARWTIWRNDLSLAAQWLQDNNFSNVGLWGLRLGGLLALDFACQSGRSFPFIVLWQPPFSGAETLREFLRLRLLHQVSGPYSRMTSKQLREELASGKCIEVAGWELSPELAFALEGLQLSSLISRASSHIYYVEFVNTIKPQITSARDRLMQTSIDNGVAIDFHQLPVPAFWVDPVEVSADNQVLTDFMRNVLMRWAI